MGLWGSLVHPVRLGGVQPEFKSQQSHHLLDIIFIRYYNLYVINRYYPKRD